MEGEVYGRSCVTLSVEGPERERETAEGRR